MTPIQAYILAKNNSEEMIEEALSSTYRAGGSISFDKLPELTAANVGMMYNMTEDFVTDERFVEGAGEPYPAGTNVSVIQVTGSEPPVYKFNVLTSMINLDEYLEKDEAADIYVNKDSMGITIPSLDEDGKIPSDQIHPIELNGVELYDNDRSLNEVGIKTISSAEIASMWDN